MHGGHHTYDPTYVGKGPGGVYSWSKDDDMRLTEIMKKYKNPKDWEPIAKEFGRGKRLVHTCFNYSKNFAPMFCSPAYILNF